MRLPRRHVIRLILAALLPAGGVLGRARARAEEPVDLLLVLAADVSRSMDDAKFRLQRQGYAAAITHPRVIRAMMSGQHARIALCYMEWSGPTAQLMVIDWTAIAAPDDAEEFAQRLRTAPRSFMERTSISGAIDFAMTQFAKSPYSAARRVIDISGDGTNNSGRDVTIARNEAVARGVTINGLVILSEEPLPMNPQHTHPPGGLPAYYEQNVIGGQGAFMVVAEGFESFGSSILSKLIKEIAAPSSPLPATSRGEG